MTFRTLLRAIFLSTAILGTSASEGRSQWTDPTAWTAHTSMNDVRAAVYRNDTLWVGTGGGVFSYSFATGGYNVYRGINELVSTDILSMAINPANGEVFAGSADGILSLWKGERWKNITSIRSANLPNTAINAFLFKGDSVFVAAGYGISIFSARREVFIEDIFRLSSLPVRTPIYALQQSGGYIWAATEGNIARAPLSSATLANPDAWEIFPIPTGTGNATTVRYLTTLGETLYCATNNEIFRFNGTTFEKVPVQLLYTLRGIQAFGDEIFLTTDFELLRLQPDNQTVVLDQEFSTSFNTAVRFSRNGGNPETAILTRSAGIRLASNKQTIVPNSPVRNQFFHTGKDAQGRIWCVSGRTDREAGTVFYLDEDRKWQPIGSSVLASNIYHRINIAQDNTVWASGFGNGLLHLRLQNGNATAAMRYTGENAPFASAVTNGDYYIIGDALQDNRKTLWTTSFNVSGIVAKDSTGKWYTFTHRTSSPRQLLRLTIDNSDTKWIGSYDREGLSYFNHNGTLDDISDDKWGLFTSANSSLPDNSITALKTDRTGNVWIGTRSGVAVIANPSEVRSNTPRFILRNVRELAGQFVNDIAIDAANQKWIATSSGLWIISADGAEVLETITAENSFLPTSQIESVLFDGDKGVVWIGTDRGLFEVKTRIATPETEFATLRCYPQPFVPDRDDELVIDGLAGNATVTIMTIAGEIVRTLPLVNSRLAVWNGRTDKGDFAPAGVYIVSAYSADTGTTAVAKVALLYNR